MHVLIIEDEELGAMKLRKMLATLYDDIEIDGITDSIESTVAWLSENPSPDLIFMDIELSDGQSFEIFNLATVKCPVIFTTSYDEYALRAFKVNSVDYLLKPIQKEELEQAVEKFRNNFSQNPGAGNVELLLKDLHHKLGIKEYRKRFLVKAANKLVSVEVSDIQYFYAEGRVTFFKTSDNRKFIVDYTIEELEQMLDPSEFFRISRPFLVAVRSIDKIEDFFGNRLILKLKPNTEKEALVSREKVTDFKIWMGK